MGVTDHQLQRCLGLRQNAIQRLREIAWLVGRHDDAD
ncbi:excisionase family protein [Xanthomonas arboricola pv. juglandis]|nr:excisionase family protein [Xanthomonas arboricola pv. juglandis]